MTHSDPELLAMIAMGEPDVPEEALAHIRSCADCQTELRSLQRVADLARSGSLDDPLGAPRPEVWTRISESLGLDPALRPASVLEAERAAPGMAVASAGGVIGGDTGRQPAQVPAPAERADSTRRSAGTRSTRGRRTAIVVVSGLLAAAAAVTATVLFTRPVPGEVLASARLDPLADGADLTGDAVVERTDAGGRDIVVRLDESPRGDDYREVWLLSPELDRLISLGTLTGASGRFALPEGVDLADYPVVDISIEPLDGDPAHSGDSILRGDLDV